MSTRKQTDDDFDREIRAHLDLETERLIEAGLSPDAARTTARRRFGNVTSARERFYEAGRLLWLDHLWQDVRCAIRNASRYPVAATIAIASLAAGIGATTVTLTIRDVIFHKPPPLYRQPDDLSRIQVGRPDRPIMRMGSPVPAALYAIWSDALGPAIAASTAPRGLREVRAGDRTGTVPHRATTSDFFSVLGISAGARDHPRPGASRRLVGASHDQLRHLAVPLRRPGGRCRPRHLDREPAAHHRRGTAHALLVRRYDVGDLDEAGSPEPSARRGARPHRAASGWSVTDDARGATPERAGGVRARASGGRAAAQAEGERHQRRAPDGRAFPCLCAGDRGAADPAYRLRERRDPADRAVDRARARDRDPRVDWRRAQPDRAPTPDRIGAHRALRRCARRVRHAGAARLGSAPGRRRHRPVRHVDRPAHLLAERAGCAARRHRRRRRTSVVRNTPAPHEPAPQHGQLGSRPAAIALGPGRARDYRDHRAPRRHFRNDRRLPSHDERGSWIRHAAVADSPRGESRRRTDRTPPRDAEPSSGCRRRGGIDERPVRRGWAAGERGG